MAQPVRPGTLVPAASARTLRRAADRTERKAGRDIGAYEAELRAGLKTLADLRTLSQDAERVLDARVASPGGGSVRHSEADDAEASGPSSPMGEAGPHSNPSPQGEVAPGAASPVSGDGPPGAADGLPLAGGNRRQAEGSVGTDGIGNHGPMDRREGRDDHASAALAGLSEAQRIQIHRRADSRWSLNGRLDQQPPADDWRTWLLLGGRGSGKTRAGAEWVHAMASAAGAALRIALVAETLADAREVMVDGVSGLWRIARDRRPAFEISRRRLVWPNGSVAQLFSSEDPESLRGPQFDLAWCDELGKWKHAQETWDMLQFGLRLGREPRQVVTTTPRAIPLIKAIIADPGTVTSRLSTLDNAGNLAPGFIRAMEARYGGTRLGRQELDGELIEDREDALWNRQMLERSRIRQPGPLGRIVVAVDPPAAERAKNSCCGIVVAGLEASGRAAVLADLSVANASPGEWGEAVVRAFRRFQADRVVAEVNQGGDMVAAILRSIDAGLPVTTVRATRGKYLRAEPVAALYGQGRVAHAGTFPALEDQMCDFDPEGLSGGASPDRLDALVWALTSLMLSGQGEPRVRGM